MIRTNLSTRPFYNEQAVRLWLLLVTLVIVIATVFNVTRIARYQGSDKQFASEGSADEARATAGRRQAAQLRASIDGHVLDRASSEAREANQLIDRRTFSWTDLFNRFEATLPDYVRIIAVRPKLDEKLGMIIDIAVAARGFEDVKQFIDNLQTAGVFADDLQPVEEHVDEDGSWLSTLEGRYVAPAPPTGDAGHGGDAGRVADAALAKGTGARSAPVDK